MRRIRNWALAPRQVLGGLSEWTGYLVLLRSHGLLLRLERGRATTADGSLVRQRLGRRPLLLSPLRPSSLLRGGDPFPGRCGHLPRGALGCGLSRGLCRGLCRRFASLLRCAAAPPRGPILPHPFADRLALCRGHRTARSAFASVVAAAGAAASLASGRARRRSGKTRRIACRSCSISARRATAPRRANRTNWDLSMSRLQL